MASSPKQSLKYFVCFVGVISQVCHIIIWAVDEEIGDRAVCSIKVLLATGFARDDQYYHNYFKCFQDLDGCLCINPGRLVKGQTGGTFAKMLVKPRKPQNLNKSSVVEKSIAQVFRLQCKIKHLLALV